MGQVNAVMGPTVLEILSAEKLAKLRAHFKEERLVQIARDTTLALYPGSTGWGTFVLNHLYEPGVTQWEPGRREQVVVGVLAVQLHGQGLFLAIHMYWALMHMEPRMVAETLVLAATYGGIHIHNAAMATLSRTLHVLARLADEPREPDADAVFAELRKILI